MKRLFLFSLIFLISIESNSQDSVIIRAEIIDSRVLIYKDSLSINLLGSIPKTKNLFLLAPSGSCFFAYGNGLTGYVTKNFIDYNINASRYLNRANLKWKINEAIRNDSLLVNEYLAKLKKDSLKHNAEIELLLEKGKKDGLHVTDFTLTGNEYKIGFEIEYLNFVNKTIKYINVTIEGYNDVNDKEATKIFKGVGPIPYIGLGKYNYYDAFYSKVITKLKIIKISIDYMDGSKRVFVGPELKKTLTYLEKD